MANVQQIIVDAAQRHNVPVEALLAIAKIESGFNPNAQNPNSSAGGVFQFTDATAREYGLTGDKRNDVAAQADAAARMVQTNSRALSSTLGRAPTAGELYLAHQQGLTGARALLANPDKTAAEALAGIYGGRAASVVRQNGGDPNARASQFASQWVNKGNQTAGLFPPGELPQVASLQDTRRPALPPVPVTSSPDMSLMRSNRPPTGLVSDSFAQIPRPGGNNLGDSLAMNPVSGGRQQAPMFDGIYDERINAVRPSGGPINTQGMATMRSSAPAPVPASPYDRVTARLNALPPVETARQAPVPAMPSPQLAGRRATDPTLQAALNYKYPARLPDIPPPSGAGPTTRAVQSVPVRGNVPSGGFAGQERAPSTLPRLTVEQMYAGIYPEQPGDFLLGGNTPNLPTIAPAAGITPYQVAQIGVPAMPEIPGAPRTRMASAAPFPMPRPSFMPAVGTSLSVRPMPPMPIARPQIAQQRRAPVPMPLAMRPAQQRAPLRIVVQRDQPQQQQPKPTPQGFSQSGNGSLTSDQYGSTYYSRHL